MTGSAGVSINLVMITEGVGERLLHGTFVAAGDHCWG